MASRNPAAGIIKLFEGLSILLRGGLEGLPLIYPVERFGIIKLFEGLSANWGTFCTPLCSKSCCIAVWFLSLGGGEVDSGSIGLIMYRYNSLFGIAGLPPSCYNNKNVDNECINED